MAVPSNNKWGVCSIWIDVWLECFDFRYVVIQFPVGAFFFVAIIQVAPHIIGRIMIVFSLFLKI